MSLFEFTFGLQAIILGLGLTHMVSALSRLWQARERVRWALQPLLGAALVFVTILLWWSQSWARQTDSTTVGTIIVDVLLNVLLFAAAASVLPDEAPRGEVTDLGAHFDRQRVTFFSLYALPIVIMGIARPLLEWAQGTLDDPWGNWPNAMIVAAMALCMVVRNRWVNIAVLSALLLFVVSVISQYRLTGG